MYETYFVHAIMCMCVSSSSVCAREGEFAHNSAFVCVCVCVCVHMYVIQAGELGAGLAETTPRRRIQFVESSRAGVRRRKSEKEEEAAVCPPGVVPLDMYEGRNSNVAQASARGGIATHRTANGDASSSDDSEDDEPSDGPSSVLDLEWKDVRKVQH